jgi:hypothetical protein
VFIPWLWNYGSEIKVKPIDLENPQPCGVRNATPEEIEAGRFFASFDEYKAANAA